MPTVEQKIEDLTRTFMTAMKALVQEAALELVRETLGSAGARSRSASAAAGANGAARRSAASAAPPQNGSATVAFPRARGRRSERQMHRAIIALEAYIRANPGQNAEQIGAGLGAKTSEIARPIQKLLAAGTVRREGVKRATRYFSP